MKFGVAASALAIAGSANPASLAAQDGASVLLEDARIVFDGQEIIVANSRIERRFAWQDGALATTYLGFGEGDRGWTMSPPQADLSPLGRPQSAGRAGFHARMVEASPTAPAFLEFSVVTRAEDLDVRRVCRIYPRVPAIPCTISYRGDPRPSLGMDESGRDVIEQADLTADRAGDAIDSLALPEKHWTFTISAFHAATDYNDWLVDEDEGELYRQPQARSGNVLLLQDRFGPGQIFIVKGSPVGADQIAWPGHDFVLQRGAVRVEGSGIDPQSLSADRWHVAYSATVGVADHGRFHALLAMREYMETRRAYDHARDGMMLMNTWGDRNRDAAMSEEFALAQLDAAHRLGLTHLQLDDGWQAGLSKNSAAAEGALWEEWSAEAWEPHPVRFPAGLAPVIERADELGMEVGLWFNPTRSDDYAQWQRDADILIGLNRRYGIRIFKIDGIELPNRAAAENLGRLFQRVYDATEGAVVFNLDVTAGRRPGYFDQANRFGNLFVENRYTDWGNYYPYRTLRNLWMLSAYVPPQFLQMEFLNVWRNVENFPAGDPLAPHEAGFDYAFATVMMSQPLAWFEATGLPPSAFAHSGLIATYREHAAAIHSGRILPIGDRPDGTSWTGFQSIDRGGTGGYLLVFREFNDRNSAKLRAHLPANTPLHLELVAGSGETHVVEVQADGSVPMELPEPHSFALYRYSLR